MTLSYHKRARTVRPIPPGSLTNESHTNRRTMDPGKRRASGGRLGVAPGRWGPDAGEEKVWPARQGPYGGKAGHKKFPESWLPRILPAFGDVGRRDKLQEPSRVIALCCARRAFNLSTISILQKTSLCIGHVANLILARWPISNRSPGMHPSSATFDRLGPLRYDGCVRSAEEGFHAHFHRPDRERGHHGARKPARGRGGGPASSRWKG